LGGEGGGRGGGENVSVVSYATVTAGTVETPPNAAKFAPFKYVLMNVLL
jgi:hypothetical protein